MRRCALMSSSKSFTLLGHIFPVSWYFNRIEFIFRFFASFKSFSVFLRALILGYLFRFSHLANNGSESYPLLCNSHPVPSKIILSFSVNVYIIVQAWSLSDPGLDFLDLRTVKLAYCVSLKVLYAFKICSEYFLGLIRGTFEAV